VPQTAALRGREEKAEKERKRLIAQKAKEAQERKKKADEAKKKAIEDKKKKEVK